MKSIIQNILYTITAFLALLPVQASVQAGDDTSTALVIRGGWLFDSISNERRANSGIIIRGGMITHVDVDASQKIPKDAKLIELTDSMTILPGLIDLHAHYNMDLVDKGRVEEVAHNGTIFLANGITSTWSAGEYYPEKVIAQRDLINSGDAIGPRLFASGPYFGAFRCEYTIKVAADDCIGWPNDITEKEIRAEVDHWASKGVISLKIKQATPAEAKIIIDQANKHGMTTAGHLVNYHVQYDITTREAILMGMGRIEHQLTPALSTGDPRAKDVPEMVDLMIKHQVYYGANLQMYGGIIQRKKNLSNMIWADEAKYFTPYAQKLLEERGEPGPESSDAEYTQRVIELKALYAAGGENLLIVGTDEPIYTNLLPGFAYHRELLALTDADLPPAVILKAATINGAAALGLKDKLGSVEAGKIADLIVVQGNPLEDIKTARNVKIVIKDGMAHDAKALLRTAEGKIGPSGPENHAKWELKLRPLKRIK